MAYEELASRLSAIREKLNAAAVRSGRNPEDVRIMAVTKTHPVQAVRAAITAGITLFGESRVQEASEKFADVTEPVRLELIGHLQRNKAKLAASTFAAVQSIDREETLAALARYLREMNRTMDILIEVNTSGEETKNGCRTDSEVFRLIDSASGYGCFSVHGLMTIGPWGGDTRAIRTAFRSLARLRQSCAVRFPMYPWDTLSMGMSEDCELAVEEGSTLVRIGTALFGARSGPA